MQLQVNLWNGFIDRCRTGTDQSIAAMLSSLITFFNSLWLPEVVRTQVFVENTCHITCVMKGKGEGQDQGTQPDSLMPAPASYLLID